ncbi:MAG: hypothetical protein DA330_10025 [Nitrososphaera sp.]|nr:hypothetical protein [Nitrososphaera sp.]
MQELRPAWLFRARSPVFVVFVVAFVALSAAIAAVGADAPDDSVNRYAKSIQGNAALDTVMIVITTTGDVGSLIIVAIILTIIRRTRKIGMILLIAIVILAIAVMYMKPFIARPLPPYKFEPALQLPENFGIESDSLAPFAKDLSFPSGHTARVTAFAFIIGFALYKRSKTASYAIWAFPVIIGITRVYVQQHYPTDLIGGFLIGMIISVVLCNAMKIWQPFQMSRFKGKEDKPPSEVQA